MLADGHELDVVKTGFLHIGDEPLGDLLVVKPAVGVLRIGAPGAQMDLVDVHRAVFAVIAAAQPALVLEGIGGQVLEDGRVMGAQLHKKSVRVAVIQPAAVRAVDAVFIFHPRLGLGNGALPEVSVVHLDHGQLLPAAEVPDEGNFLGAGGKGAEYRPFAGEVGAQVVVGVKGAAGIKSIKIHKVLLKMIDMRWKSSYTDYNQPTGRVYRQT